MFKPQCPYCNLKSAKAEYRTKSPGSSVVRMGFFRRKSDRVRVFRFFCKNCHKHFSSASFDICYRQKRRDLNSVLATDFSSGYSQRRLAFNLGINRKTVARKLMFLGLIAQFRLRQFNSEHAPATEVQFDDLETHEQTKYKPLSVTLAVESGTRRILGFRVSSMPAKGLLAKKALKKYGHRNDKRAHARDDLFSELKEFVSQNSVFRSDQNPHYAKQLFKHFPQAEHFTVKGRRGCVTGQGELKEGKFDPLFSLNHTFAMLRANINRLFRKTWNTTKKAECLAAHIAIYAVFHNEQLLPNPSK